MPESLASLFLSRVKDSTANIALMYKEQRSPYRDMTWSELGNFVKEVAYGLAALGLESKQTAAIIAPTSHLWVVADQAILVNGSISVPIYPTSSSSDIEHILNNSESTIVFVYNESLLNKLLAVKNKLTKLEKIILLTAPNKGRSLSELCLESKISTNLVIGLEELLNKGRSLQLEKPLLIEQRSAEVKSTDTATIIYTSGTTGTPKGVILTNNNILSVLADLPEVIPINQSDRFLSFLPLSHVFERICGEFYWIYSGASCAFAEGIEYVAKNMAETHPTVMLVVPRILDKIYTKVKAGIDGTSQRRRKLIEWSINVGKSIQAHKNSGLKPRKLLDAKYWFAEKMVLSKLREKIGSRLSLIISGGAPATPEVLEFFNAIGITVLEGYGLSETAAPTNVNRVSKNKFGSVGPKLASVEMKIAEDGEVCFRGPTIFSGYYKSEDLTTEVFQDGWFHTGDIGIVDEDGYLKITDRKKDIIVNSAGKNIAPQKIENVLKNIPLISQAIVFGDKRKTLVALLTLDEQAATEFASENNIPFKDFCELTQSSQIRKYIKNAISEKCKNLADYERVRDFDILSQELSVENGELTATLKIRRNILKIKYKDRIEALYKEDSVLASQR